jgi:predicted transcriptional regulator
METGMNMDGRAQINLAKEQTAVLSNLLGSLELEVMEFMWQAGEATVRQVGESISRQRPIAYTTVMTVMGHLADKGLLTRTLDGKRYRYRVAQGRNEFLYQASQRMIRTLVEDFGDLAVAGFLGEISKVEPGRLEQLRRLAQETRGETGAPE